MKKYTAEELALILEKHAAWLRDEAKGERANLRSADLRYADLSSANLSSANLRSANLRSANLRSANLRSADLRSANLSSADLSYANLRSANLSSADLSSANLSSANLRSANLSSANLRSANLSSANLSSADLPALTVVLIASWGDLPDDICLHLMRLDASAHDDPQAFEVWANNGPCPYADRRYQRCANFHEKRSIYTPGPAPTIYEAAAMVLREKTKGWEPK